METLASNLPSNFKVATPKRVNIYIIFIGLSLHTTAEPIAKPSLACANPVQVDPAAAPRNIYAA